MHEIHQDLTQPKIKNIVVTLTQTNRQAHMQTHTNTHTYRHIHTHALTHETPKHPNTHQQHNSYLIKLAMRKADEFHRYLKHGVSTIHFMSITDA